MLLWRYNCRWDVESITTDPKGTVCVGRLNFELIGFSAAFLRTLHNQSSSTKLGEYFHLVNY